MTRIPVHSVASAPEVSRDALKALEAPFGTSLAETSAAVVPTVVIAGGTALTNPSAKDVLARAGA